MENQTEQLTQEKIEKENSFNKNLLFLHDLVVCPNCAVKVRVTMEAVD